VKIIADHANCQGHARCQDSCPELFSTDDQLGKVIVLQEQVPSHLESAARMAVRNCPEGALSIVDDYQG